jgi:mono/diheme cytochrome c family protein
MSWPEIHGGLTHFPVALIITACVFEIGGVLIRRPIWRAVSFWLLAAAVLMAVPTLIAGWKTADQLYGGIAQPPAEFIWHRAAALTATSLAFLLLLWRVATGDRVAGKALWAETAIMLAAAGAVGVAGYLGGHIVFAAEGKPVTEPSPPPPSLVQALPDDHKPGLRIYRQFCVRCHGIGGQGDIGPRLAGNPHSKQEVIHVVTHGKPPVMPALGKQFSPAQIRAVAPYMHWLGSEKGAEAAAPREAAFSDEK